MRSIRAVFLASLVMAVAGCWRTATICDETDGCDTNDADSDTDSDTDTETETATDTEGCADPCLDGDGQPIAGCLDPCGGWPDPEPPTCPEEMGFQCVTLTDVDDAPGMCLPADSFFCEQSSGCACFPPFPACENASQETIWTCAGSGQCAATCE